MSIQINTQLSKNNEKCLPPSNFLGEVRTNVQGVVTFHGHRWGRQFWFVNRTNEKKDVIYVEYIDDLGHFISIASTDEDMEQNMYPSATSLVKSWRMFKEASLFMDTQEAAGNCGPSGYVFSGVSILKVIPLLFLIETCYSGYTWLLCNIH